MKNPASLRLPSLPETHLGETLAREMGGLAQVKQITLEYFTARGRNNILGGKMLAGIQGVTVDAPVYISMPLSTLR